jgi:hypothetical protein
MAEKIKQTRLEELDLRAKSLLEAWNKDTFGQQQQTAAGVNDSTLPFKRFAADHHKRRTETQIQASAIEAYKDGGYDAFFKEANETSRTDPPTLEERWEKSAFKGGPANEAKGGGSSTTNVSAKLSSPRPYEGEQNGQLSIKFNDQDFFVPDSPFNRDIWEKFQTTYTSGKPDEDGKGHFDYFFQLGDAVGAPTFGNATIRAHWQKLFGDGNKYPSSPPVKIFRRNMWAQQDLNVQYDEGRTYAFTDSYYRYDVTTPDLEFGNADDPLTKSNHQSFTLKRTDAKTIELKTNIQRATVQNPSGVQWPNKTEHGASTFTRSGGGYSTTDSYYTYGEDANQADLEFGNSDDPSTEYNHKSRILKNADTDKLKLRIFHTTRNNPRGYQWPFSGGDGTATFNKNQPYDERMRTSDVKTEFGYVVAGSTKIIPTALAWPQVSSIPPNKTPFADNRPAKNLEELWFSLANMKTVGPRSDQVQRPGNDSRISTIFSASNVSAADYKVRFLGALNGSFANVPGPDAVTYQGLKGFNVGQVAPYNKYGTYVFGDKRYMDVTRSSVLQRILSKINSYEQQLMEIKPGGNRINIVFNIRINLDRLLEQNLLMPTDLYTPTYGAPTADLATAIEEGTSSSINDDTFTKLYLQNRSALHSADRPISNGVNYRRKPPGTIAGVPVASLQGPVSYQKGHVANGMDNTTDEDDNSAVFKFEEDYKRNNPITKDRGFIDNISGQVHGNRSGIAGLMPAVENDPGVDFPDETSFLKSRGRANEQFFPFMFETVNKKGSSRTGTEFKQYAYFQATLQSLNESYAPAWSSKHFFGRTEQIHTYTMTDRTLDLSFVIFATEIRRLQNLYERVSWLAQQTYPSYDVDNRIKSGPLIRMTIGDMFSNLTGFIRSLSFDWNYLGPGGKWEITQGLRIPMACTVSMNFTVMHDDMPDRNYAFYPGMLEGGSGLMGRRGKTNVLPNGGPLIATAERVKRAQAGRNAEFAGQDNVRALEAMSDQEKMAYLNLKEAEAARAGGRGQQYIDSLYNNRSTGNERQNASNETDLVF